MAILGADVEAVVAIMDSAVWTEKELEIVDLNGRTPLLNAAFAYQLDMCLLFLVGGWGLWRV